MVGTGTETGVMVGTGSGTGVMVGTQTGTGVMAGTETGTGVMVGTGIGTGVTGVVQRMDAEVEEIRRDGRDSAAFSSLQTQIVSLPATSHSCNNKDSNNSSSTSSNSSSSRRSNDYKYEGDSTILSSEHVIQMSSSNDTIIGRCVDCSCPYDLFSGLIVCTVCRLPVLVCGVCAVEKCFPGEYHCFRHR